MFVTGTKILTSLWSTCNSKTAERSCFAFVRTSCSSAPNLRLCKQKRCLLKHKSYFKATYRLKILHLRENRCSWLLLQSRLRQRRRNRDKQHFCRSIPRSTNLTSMRSQEQPFTALVKAYLKLHEKLFSFLNL